MMMVQNMREQWRCHKVVGFEIYCKGHLIRFSDGLDMECKIKVTLRHLA